MSHLDEQHDMLGLPEVGDGVTEADVESVKQARLEARRIIHRLEPCHIRSRDHLATILADESSRFITEAEKTLATKRLAAVQESVRNMEEVVSRPLPRWNPLSFLLALFRRKSTA